MMARNQYSHNLSGFPAVTFRMHLLYLSVWWSLMNMALVHSSPLVGYKTDSEDQLLLKANNNVDDGDFTGVHSSTVEYAQIPNELESRRIGSLSQGAQQSLETLIGADQVPVEHSSNSNSSEETALESFQQTPEHKIINWPHDRSVQRDKRSDNSVLEKRKWSNRMSAWGKRASPSVDGMERNRDIDTKKWSSSFNAWGRRDSDSYAKKWASMSAWGKRWTIPQDDWERYVDEDTANKRWAKSMNAWGKRNDEGTDEYSMGKRWSNRMSAWGKRNSADSGSNDRFANWRDDILEEDKRWTKGMNAWGKRDDSFTEYDKKWTNSMNAWGKRDNDMNGNADIDKRWAKTMSAWGKRDPSADEVQKDDKRWAKAMNAWGKRNVDKKWSSAMNAWGKRDNLEQDLSDNEKRWSNAMDAWGKRWSHAMNAWGKRNTKKWSSAMNAWGKRQMDDPTDKTRNKRWSSSMNSVSNQEPMDFAKSYQTLKYIQDSLDSVGQHDNQVTLSGNGLRDANNRPYSDLSNGFVPAKRTWMPSSHYWIKRTNFPYFGGPKRGWRGHDLNVWG